MSDQLTYDEILEAEMKKYPQLFIWGNLAKIISLVPALLYLMMLAIITLESPDSVFMFTLRGFLYFACYGGFLKTFTEFKKADAFVYVFGIGTVAFFINNLFYTGSASIIGILIDLVMVLVATSVYNFHKARNDAQQKAFELNRYQLNKKAEQMEKEEELAKAESQKNQAKKASDTVKDIELNTTFSKAFEEFQKNK